MVAQASVFNIAVVASLYEFLLTLVNTKSSLANILYQPESV
jgi:hypothetical protein